MKQNFHTKNTTATFGTSDEADTTNKKIEGKLNPESFERLIDVLKSKKKSFTVSVTGYTQILRFDNKTFVMSDTQQSDNKKVYLCAKKIKADIEKTDVIIDAVPFTSIRYYSVNEFLRRTNLETPNTCLYIDIKSAYLTSLLNAGIVTKETFDYVSNAGKGVRLRSVGMLATNKTLFTFEGGDLTDTKQVNDPVASKYFFYACLRIGEVMGMISSEYGQDFLFFWFDGIYLHPGCNPDKAFKILTDAGFQYTFQTLSQVQFTPGKRTLYFECLHPGDEKKKRFNVPFNDDIAKSRLTKYLNKK